MTSAVKTFILVTNAIVLAFCIRNTITSVETTFPGDTYHVGFINDNSSFNYSVVYNNNDTVLLSADFKQDTSYHQEVNVTGTFVNA
jgi:hypothetical protein